MRLHQILLITCMLTAASLSAQTGDKLLIAKTVDKKDYFYIPASALADSVQAILYQDNMYQKPAHGKTPIKFYWISACNDGYYNLTVTPQQIFFSSSHDNPNPNFLYWVIDIDSFQFNSVRQGLNKKWPADFENLSKHYDNSYTVLYDKYFKDSFTIADEWNDANRQQYDLHCETQINTQLNRYFSIINSLIADTTRKIHFPDEKERKLFKPKYFSYLKDEIFGWVPLKFDPPAIYWDE